MTARSTSRPVPARRGLHPLRAFLLGTGVLLFSTALLLLIGEGIARRGFAKEKAADARMVGSPIGYDPRFGFKGIPGFNGIAGGVRVRINEHGFRDDSWGEKLARCAQYPARPRILLLGDSMTYGYFISKNFRIGEQLEAFYTAHLAGAEVFNAAIPGYGPAEQTQVLESLLPVIKPDIVILRYCAVDFGDRPALRLPQPQPRLQAVVHAGRPPRPEHAGSAQVFAPDPRHLLGPLRPEIRRRPLPVRAGRPFLPASGRLFRPGHSAGGQAGTDAEDRAAGLPGHGPRNRRRLLGQKAPRAHPVVRHAP
ncbi:MAG: SGNH/GDSL hydrolase family protein [Kiritimatiellia bacterium]